MQSIRSLRPNVIAHRVYVVVVKHVGFRFISASVVVQKLAVPRLQHSVSLPTAFGVINRHFSLTSDESLSDLPVFDIGSKLVMKNGQPFTGCGQVNFPTVGIYSGDLVDGKRHGHGGFKYFDNGNKYDGEWKDNHKEGNGIIADAEGKILSQGLFRKNKIFTGMGRIVTKAGIIYQGDVMESQRHGQGKLTYKSGEVWEGEFRHGKPFNGKGSWHDKQGVWVEGVFTAETVTSSANGSSSSSKMNVVKKEHRKRKKVPEEESEWDLPQ